MSAPRRANPAIELMNQRMSRMQTKEGRETALRFVPRSSDIIVVTPAKCGTTWMTQIIHQLRSAGDMSFGDIDDVVPLINLAYDVGLRILMLITNINPDASRLTLRTTSARKAQNTLLSIVSLAHHTTVGSFSKASIFKLEK